MDWAGAIGSTIAGLVVGVLILLVMRVQYRSRLRVDPSIAEQAVSVRVDPQRSRRSGLWAAAVTIANAALLTAVAEGPHPARFFFGFLCALGTLLAFYGFVFGPNTALPDIPAGEFRSMSYGKRYDVVQTYGAGRVADSMKIAARIVLVIAVPGLIVSLLIA